MIKPNARAVDDGGIQNENSNAMTGAGFMGDFALAQSAEMSAVDVDTSKPVGAKEIDEAWQTLMRYKEGKANLERRIIDSQQWYKLRQWECLRRKDKKDKNSKDNQVEPVSAWLFNAICNKHADAMDNYPRAVILPREESDQQQAKTLSSIVPVVMDMCDFEQVYSDVMDDKLIAGTGVYGVFWDASKHNGLGDIDIEAIDIINLFWEPGITDIQQTRNLFYLSLRDSDLLAEEYPQLKDHLTAPVIDIGQYVYDDNVDTTKKSVVVDWYYKKRQGGKTVLHYCKFIAGHNEPIFASENETEPVLDEFGAVISQPMSETGWYEHGLYPFIFDPLFRTKGTPCGFGYVDVGKNTQEYIDRGDKAIMQNMLFNCKPRHFIRNDGSVNEQEYADVTSDFVHVDGALGQDSIMPVNSKVLSPIYVNILNNKIDELKETTGNRDVSTGGTTGGATAAAAIAAMQEAGSKLSRDSSKAAYRAYRRVVLMIIELMRQFYDTDRCFRILGEDGTESFVHFSNAGITPQAQGTMLNGVPMEIGIDVGYRLPLFDVNVSAEKNSPYSRLSQNELAMQFYTAGFFNPAAAESALACLTMMDFDGKDSVVRTIKTNATMFATMNMAIGMALELAEQQDAATGGNLVAQLAAQFGMMDSSEPVPASSAVRKGTVTGGESKVTKDSRARTANAAAPR